MCVNNRVFWAGVATADQMICSDWVSNQSSPVHYPRVTWGADASVISGMSEDITGISTGQKKGLPYSLMSFSMGFLSAFLVEAKLLIEFDGTSAAS